MISHVLLLSFMTLILHKRGMAPVLVVHLIRSILFWRMMMCWRRIISTAARCSLVCGCGHVSLAAISSSAPSITAAPFSMVAMRIS